MMLIDKIRAEIEAWRRENTRLQQALTCHEYLADGKRAGCPVCCGTAIRCRALLECAAWIENIVEAKPCTESGPLKVRCDACGHTTELPGVTSVTYDGPQ